MKKIIKWLLVAVMCLGFSVPVFAFEYTHHFSNGEIRSFSNYIVYYEAGTYGFVLFDESCIFRSNSGSKENWYSFSGGLSLNSGKYSYPSSCLKDLDALDGLTGGFSFSSHEFGFSEKSPDKMMYSNHDIINVDTNLVHFSANRGSDPPSKPRYKYCSTIPAPQGLKFTSSGSGGFLGINKKYKHNLTWSNSFSEDLKTRISVQYKYTTSDGLQQYDDFELSSDFPANSNSWFQNVDDIKDAIMTDSYSSLNALNQYRIQFYKVVDGVEHVGPVGVVHLNKTFFGDYTGSTVTTEYPVDPENPSGGMDSFGDGWTSDGQDYVDYDKDGNVIGSGSSDGGLEGSGDPLTWIINHIRNIPKVITSFFSSLQSILNGILQLPDFLAKVMSWMPTEIFTLITAGISVVILLRIFGR